MEKFNKNIEQEISSNPWEISADEFQSFSLEYLNETAVESLNEREKSADQIRQDLESIFEKSDRENQSEARKDIFQRNTERGRETSNLFSDGFDGEPVEYWQDYGVGFAEYAGRENFIVRNQNRGIDDESLSREISQVKSEVRRVDFSQKMSNLGRAIIGKAA